MLAPAVMFWQVILAIHIVAVVVAFGVTFAYPLIFVFAEQLDRRSVPVMHRIEKKLGEIAAGRAAEVKVAPVYH